MNPKTVQFQYDINRMDAVNLVATIHIDDYDTRFLEVLLCERGGAFDVSGSTAAARFVTLAGELLNDSVPCAVEGNAVTVPIDAAAVKSQACTLKIEINLTKDGKVLTLPFPLFVRVRGSILDDAQVTPESEGTIADLLKAAQEALDAAAAALEDAGDYSKLDNKPQINGHTLSGNKTSSELGLQDKLTAGENVTIDENGVISAEGGTDDYNELSNKPSINNVELSGNQTPTELDIDDYTKLRNLPKISYNMGTSGSMTESLIGRLAFGSGIRIEKTTYGMENLFAFEVDPSKVFTAVRGNTNLDLNSTVSQPFLFVAKRYRFTNLPSFVSVGNNDDIGLLNLSGQDIGQSMQILYWVDSNGHSHYALRVQYSQWREIKDGSQIVSGVVNQNGTITFTDSAGNVVNTTGDRLVTSGNQQISMGYDSGGFYFLFDDGQEVVNNVSN